MKQVKKLLSVLLVMGVIFSSMTGCSESTLSEQNADGTKQATTAVIDETKEANAGQDTEQEFAGDGTWTILIYMCGTDLESGQGSATDDINEMLSADTGSNARYVIQTGGCSEWQNDLISSDKIERYEIQNGSMNQISSKKNANMGKESTLTDFVKWGQKQYGENKLGLVFWDHGGGSISGVCMDENYNGDTLTLSEIDSSLKNLNRKLNFVGFDACLMSTLENADMLSEYASYMIASEETESGYGWDYKAISKKLKKENAVSTVELGKTICDSFYKSCEKSGEEATTTLAVTDLSKIADVSTAFDQVAEKMTSSISDVSALGTISKGIKKAENYGGNTPSEGYTNMVDLGDIAKKISSCIDTTTLENAIQTAVVYQIKGKKRSGANGLSVYYPLEVQSKDELVTFEKICVSEHYLNFIGAMLYGASTGDTDGYSGKNDWSEVEEGSDDFTSDQQNKIKLSEELHLNKDNYYTFTIAKDSLPKVASVQYNLYMVFDDESPMCYLGSDNDLDFDDSTGVVTDNFQGYWPCLPDGSLLTMYVIEESDEYTIFSSPIKLNDTETNLRFMYTYGETDEDGEWSVLGTWKGVDAYGQAAKELTPVQKGDKIVPIYVSVDPSTLGTDTINGDTYKVSADFNIQELSLPKGDYLYNFSIIDIFGTEKYLDLVNFHVNKKGEVELNE